MQAHLKFFVAAAVVVAASAAAGVAAGQTAADGTRSTDRSAGEATRDTANAVGRAGSAAVTPGDQDMGRNPDNRSGGLMGDDRNNTGSATTNRARVARADRG